MSYGSSSYGSAPLASTQNTGTRLGTEPITSTYNVQQSNLQNLNIGTQPINYSYSLEDTIIANLLTQNINYSYNILEAGVEVGRILSDPVNYKYNIENKGLKGKTTIKTESVVAEYSVKQLNIKTFPTQPTDYSYSSAESSLKDLNIETQPINKEITGLESSIFGTTTIKTEPVSTFYSIEDSELTPILKTQSISAEYSVENTKFLTFGTQKVEANYSANETRFDVLGTDDEITVLIDGQRIDTYTNIEIKKRLNEVDTFAFDAFITDDGDRALINEGNTVKFIENYDTLLFKGRLTEVEYKSNFRAKCEGDGMVTKLLNRKTDRDTYTNTNGDNIVTSEVSNTVINYGTIESAPQVSIRFDHDNLARAVAGVANATGYDWFIDQDPADDWETDRLNFVEDAGRDTVQETFDIGGNAQLVERNKDDGFVANDITLLGRGDGINQLEANVFAASTAFTDTTQIIDENETGSFTVDDATQLGGVGDNLIVRVGIETMDVTISDGTTLSINSRAVDDYNGDETEQIRHYENIRVWRLENVTQGIGRFTPVDQDSAEDGSSIEQKGVREQRDTDKTIVDLSTLEKTADLELKNRFEDVFRVRVSSTEPRITESLQLGDTVKVTDLTAMDVDDEFDIVGFDIMRSSAEEGTTLHLANRPRRLTERLSEIESDRDTLNAHMQGATNFNGEHFENNCDETHPLNNKVFIPDDVVKINKFELTFARESFRGFVQNTGHSHTIENIPDHSHDVEIDVTGHTHNLPTEPFGASVQFIGIIDAPFGLEKPLADDIDWFNNDTIEFTSREDIIITTGVDPEGPAAGDSGHYHQWPSGGDLPGELGINNSSRDHAHEVSLENFTYNTNIDISYDGIETTESDGDIDVNIESDAQNTPDTTETTLSAGEPDYGIFEPAGEPDIDVEVRVDGNLVETITDVSVGDEITNPIDLKNDLAEPLTGRYHDIELTPVNTGGGNNGRSRLVADVTEKVFIESTL